MARRRAAREARAGLGSSDLAAVPGVPASFASCVALRESTDGQDPNAHGNIYGILPSNGYTEGMGLAEQKRLFSRMYAENGISPWEPYDGC